MFIILKLRRRLAEQDMHVRIPAIAPVLNLNNRRSRLQFVRKHVLFTDERRFCLYSSDRRVRIIRRLTRSVRPMTLFNGKSVMVWGEISLTVRQDLVALRRSS